MLRTSIWNSRLPSLAMAVMREDGKLLPVEVIGVRRGTGAAELSVSASYSPARFDLDQTHCPNPMVC